MYLCMSWEVKKYKALENLQFGPALNKQLPAAFTISGQETCFSSCESGQEK